MNRMSLLSSPMMLGFEQIERLVERAGKSSSDAYPPYNIERVARDNAKQELLRITLAVAGFTREQLEITLEDSQLTVKGRQKDEGAHEYLFRGIAARQFQKTFVLAEGIEVLQADLDSGLLTIDLVRNEPERLTRRIDIGQAKPKV